MGTDFRVWQFKDGTLLPLGENNPYHGALDVDQLNRFVDDTGKAIEMGEICWWNKVLNALAAANVYDVHDVIPTLFVRDPSAEFQRISQGLSQRYYEVLQFFYSEEVDGRRSELQAESDFLVPAEAGKSERLP